MERKNVYYLIIGQYQHQQVFEGDELRGRQKEQTLRGTVAVANPFAMALC